MKRLAAILALLLPPSGWAANIAVPKAGAVKTPIGGISLQTGMGLPGKGLGSLRGGLTKPVLFYSVPSAVTPDVALRNPVDSVAAVPIENQTATEKETTVPAVGSRSFQKHLKNASEGATKMQAAAKGSNTGQARALGNKFFHGEDSVKNADIPVSGFNGPAVTPVRTGLKPAITNASILSALSRIGRSITPTAEEKVSRNPTLYRKFAEALTQGLAKRPAAEKARLTGAVEIAKTQNAYKALLLKRAQVFAREKGIAPKTIITNGTYLEGLLGVLFSGGIEATNPYQGFKGENAHFWGANGIESGASYGANRGVNKRQPGVMILMKNDANPLRVTYGELLNRRPTVAGDFLAVILTDGESTVLLDAPALRALAASSQLWKNTAVAQARKGNWAAFAQWERYQERFDPDK